MRHKRRAQSPSHNRRIHTNRVLPVAAPAATCPSIGVAWIGTVHFCRPEKQLSLTPMAAHPKHKEISTQTLARRVLDAGGRWLRRLRPRDAISIIRQQAIHSCQMA